MLKIAPSVLSADFTCLGKEIEDIKRAGADFVHFDVMDGMFVPNISVGIPVLKSLRRATGLFLDVHLMIERPRRYAEQFCAAGADLVNFHVEADEEEGILEALNIVKSMGKMAGVTIKPRTPAQALRPFLPYIDLALVMTVEPGFGGQRFMHEQLPKIEAVRKLIEAEKPGCMLEVDGGIDGETAALVKAAGADVLVAGSAVFGKPDRAAAIEALRRA